MKIKKRYLLPVAFLGLLGIAGKTVDSGKYFEIAKNIELFANIYKEINTYYVDDLDPAKTMRIGIDAMLDHLDPYTNYISESDIEGYRYITEGKYNGFGAQIKKLGENVTIVEQYEGSPAQKAGLKVEDIGLWELNEAFAVQVLYCQDRLGIPDDRLNVNGGAIAIGHPIGASGCRILVTLLHEMQRRDAKKGVAALCIGGGMGVSLAIER